MLNTLFNAITRKKQKEALLPKDFDAVFYVEYHKDLQHLRPDQAAQHYMQAGHSENRLINFQQASQAVAQSLISLPEDFDVAEYIALNSDISNHVSSHWDAKLHYLVFGRHERRIYKRFNPSIHDKCSLNASTNNIYNQPEVVVDNSRPITVNVLVPAFEIPSISAGFFGVFQTAKFIKHCGFNVRLVLFDEFKFNPTAIRNSLKGYPGLEDLLDVLEIEYIGDRKAPLKISEYDSAVATVWYSAYLAESIMKKSGDRPFLYLIQDYETAFYAASSNYALAEQTYSMNYHALFSTSALMNHFEKNRIGKSTNNCFTYFNNASSCSLLEKSEFLKSRSKINRKQRLAFYCRPPVNRNMFELGALTLCEAVETGLLNPAHWEFYGIGLGDTIINLSPTVELKQLPRMNLKDYQQLISTFDLGVCLMASPHPSLLPFDLVGSGCSVVTNEFGIKNQGYFDGLASGIFTGQPNVPSLLDAIKRAAAQVDDLEGRYSNAATMRFPRAWDESFTEEHRQFIITTFATK